MAFKQGHTEICFDTEKGFQDFMDRIEGQSGPERNEQLKQTRERMKQIRKNSKLIINGRVVYNDD